MAAPRRWMVQEATVPPDVPLMTGFLKLDKEGIIAKTKEMGLAMSAEDLAAIFARYLTVTEQISDERMYLVVGKA